MKSPHCPICCTEFVKRVRRQGINEKLLGVCYFYPFRCQLCGHRFRLLQWGVTYVRVDHDGRAFERLPVNLSVVLASEGADHQGRVTEVSMAGCSIQADSRLTVGKMVRLSLQLTDDTPPLEVAVAVVRNVQSDRVGLEFLRLHLAESKRLEKFMRLLLIARAHAKSPNLRFRNRDYTSHPQPSLPPVR